MATGNLIKKKEEFELWLKSQIAKGCDLLKREVSEDDTTIVRYRTIVKIKEYDEEFNIYRLGFPNKEVAEGFIKYLVPYYMPIKENLRITSTS